MEWLDHMNNAISYIEDHLDEKIDYTKVAQAACCSVYHFQRMFSYMASIPLSEYVRRRRMTLAAFELQNSEIKVIDLALKFGYDSPEAFTRAFQILHGVSPSTARKRGICIKAYPRISFQITIKGDSEMNYRIEQKEAFEVYGIERVFDTNDNIHLKEIPSFWSEMLHNGSYDKLAASTGIDSTHDNGLCHVNAICGYRHMDGTTFPYMLCTMKTEKSNTQGYTTVQVPAATWAIFTNEPHSIEEISAATQLLNSRVYTDWLPTSNYEKLDGYELEMYYEDKDENYYEEIWIRVVPKNI
ncbi:AraC family transcriptional regulator [Mobilitalea sibirica]|uniref:AraC family transcriptional regulator n=1 Tax=Mobilitalea sibirica TaxID=1462919 RepID=A0A8J7L3G7_9FIRM|nr:GyrI-like domain-containing protein [Mobilitalea sibirica]MBH1942593.1 AraC family transcriptional regulator [Mobilitalea sibirica]